MAASEGFEEFVSARGQALQRFGFLLTSDWALAEDLVQTAFSRAYPRWSRIESDAPEAYLKKVMVNTWCSWWRRRWRGELPTASLPDFATGDPYAAVDRRHAVKSALAGLPDRQRLVLVLRYHEDLSVLNGAVSAWRHFAASDGKLASANSDAKAIWYVGQKVANGQVVAVIFEAESTAGPRLIAGWATASEVMHGQPGWKPGSSPWVLYDVAAPKEGKSLIVGLNVHGTSSRRSATRTTGSLSSPSRKFRASALPHQCRQVPCRRTCS